MQAAHAPGGAEGSLMTLPHHYRMVPAPGAAAQQQPDNAQQAGTSTAAAGTSSNAAATAPPAAQPAAVRQQAEEEEDGVDFDPLLFIKQLPALEACVPKLRPNILPKKTRICKRMTLVLDLDETLVHSSLEAVDKCDFSFPVTFNNMEHTVYVRQVGVERQGHAM